MNKNNGTPSSKPMVETTNEKQGDFNNNSPILDIPIPEALGNDESKNDTDPVEVPVTLFDGESVTSTSNVEVLNDSTLEICEEISSSLLAKQAEIVNTHDPVEADPVTKPGGADVPLKTDQEKSQLENIDVLNDGDFQSKPAVNTEPLSNSKKQEEQNADRSPKKVQEQLDEVKYLTMGNLVYSQLVLTSNFFVLLSLYFFIK